MEGLERNKLYALSWGEVWIREIFGNRSVARKTLTDHFDTGLLMVVIFVGKLLLGKLNKLSFHFHKKVRGACFSPVQVVKCFLISRSNRCKAVCFSSLSSA